MGDPSLGELELVVLPTGRFRGQFLRDHPWSPWVTPVPPPPWEWRWLHAHAYQVDEYDGFVGRRAIVVEAGYEGDPRRVAHEYGHSLGYTHPPWASLAMLLDVMGLGFRVRDAYGLLGASSAWRKQHGLP